MHKTSIEFKKTQESGVWEYVAGVQWVQQDMDPRIKEVRNLGERQRPGGFWSFWL